VNLRTGSGGALEICRGGSEGGVGCDGGGFVDDDFVGKRGDEMDACVVLADDLEFGLRDIARGLGTEVELRHDDGEFRVCGRGIIRHGVRLLRALGHREGGGEGIGLVRL